MWQALFHLLQRIWLFLTAPFRSHTCKQCACSEYSDEALFMWMAERRLQTSYADEMLAANIIDRPLKCSRCKHPREKHGTLNQRLLTFDMMPDGGAVLCEHTNRTNLRRKENRFVNRQVAQEQRPSVEFNEERHGEGVPVKSGDVIVCHYDAYLASSMEKFESSRQELQPFRFTFGTAEVVPGLDMGLKNVRPGAKRRIAIPSQLAYRGKEICGEPHADVVFVVDVIAVETY